MLTYILITLLAASLIANIIQLTSRMEMRTWLAKYKRRINRQDAALDKAAHDYGLVCSCLSISAAELELLKLNHPEWQPPAALEAAIGDTTTPSTLPTLRDRASTMVDVLQGMLTHADLDGIRHLISNAKEAALSLSCHLSDAVDATKR